MFIFIIKKKRIKRKILCNNMASTRNNIKLNIIIKKQAKNSLVIKRILKNLISTHKNFKILRFQKFNLFFHLKNFIRKKLSENIKHYFSFFNS